MDKHTWSTQSKQLYKKKPPPHEHTCRLSLNMPSRWLSSNGRLTAASAYRQPHTDHPVTSCLLAFVQVQEQADVTTVGRSSAFLNAQMPHALTRRCTFSKASHSTKLKPHKRARLIEPPL
jgi:hypothetical protein